MAKLTGQQIISLQEAMCETFDLDALTRLLVEINQDLEKIAGSGGTLPGACLKVIQSAEREGWTTSLLEKIAEHRSGVPEMQDLVKELRAQKALPTPRREIIHTLTGQIRPRAAPLSWGVVGLALGVLVAYLSLRQLPAVLQTPTTPATEQRLLFKQADDGAIIPLKYVVKPGDWLCLQMSPRQKESVEYWPWNATPELDILPSYQRTLPGKSDTCDKWVQVPADAEPEYTIYVSRPDGTSLGAASFSVRPEVER